MVWTRLFVCVALVLCNAAVWSSREPCVAAFWPPPIMARQTHAERVSAISSSSRLCLVICLRLEHGNVDTFSQGRLGRFFVPSIYVPRDAEAGIVCQYAIQSLRSFRCAIGN